MLSCRANSVGLSSGKQGLSLRSQRPLLAKMGFPPQLGPGEEVGRLGTEGAPLESGFDLTSTVECYVTSGKQLHLSGLSTSSPIKSK